MIIKGPFYIQKLRAFSDSGNNSKLSYNFVCLGSYTITAYSQIDFYQLRLPLIIVSKGIEIMFDSLSLIGDNNKFNSEVEV